MAGCYPSSQLGASCRQFCWGSFYLAVRKPRACAEKTFKKMIYLLYVTVEINMFY